MQVGQSLWISPINRRIIIMVGGTIYALFACYFSEVTFYFLFVKDIQELKHYTELIVTILVWSVLCLCLPMLMIFFRSKYRDYFLIFIWVGVGIPVVFVLAISFTNLSLYIESLLQHVDQNLRRSDVIIVGNKAGFERRAKYAAKLYHGNYAPLIVIFAPKNKANITFMESDLQIPQKAILWARKGKEHTTYEGAIITSQLCATYGWKDILVVSDSYQIYRTIKPMIAMGVKRIYPAPVPADQFRSSPAILLGPKYREFWQTPLSELDFFISIKFRHTLMRRVIYEHVALCFYWIKGYI